MEVPLYDDLQAYIRNSAVFNAVNTTMPLLIEVGNVDGTVWWHQGLELYSLLRRAKKPVVMIEKQQTQYEKARSEMAKSEALEKLKELRQQFAARGTMKDDDEQN